MDKKKIMEALNVDISYEIGATIQYLWHHYMAEGMESPAIIELFEKTARDEMKHIEMIAKRIIYYRGIPTTKMPPVKKGGNLKKMIQDDLDAENEAVERYRQHIKLCADEGDAGTRLMLEKILQDEEDHADTWETTLGIR